MSSKGTPFKAYVKAVTYPNKGLICEQNVDELKRIFNKKFPDKLLALDRFLSVALLTLELVPVPLDENTSENYICDVNDRLILRPPMLLRQARQLLHYCVVPEYRTMIMKSMN